MFYLYRLAILKDGEDDIEGDPVILRQGRQWVGEKWWYKLAHVCQRWRTSDKASVLFSRLFCLLKDKIDKIDKKGQSHFVFLKPSPFT
jgi:hypothetical protein